MLLFRAMTSNFDHSTPQFGTAEYLGAPGSDRCHYCQQPIGGRYYRLNGAISCQGCGEKAHSELPQDSHADYVRGIVYGVGAAIAGLILYATFTIATGIVIGYVSLAVGWMVGKAMMKGSNGHGGRRYQITAALLTYAAVSMAAVPISIHYGISGDQGLMQLAFLGLASPFRDLAHPINGAIGLFILFIGIRIAWQITRQTSPALEGPFQSPPRPPAGVSAGRQA